MEEAAILAARHSRAKDSAQVPVDYTDTARLKATGLKAGHGDLRELQNDFCRSDRI